MHIFLLNFKICTKASWHPLHPDPVFEHCLASKLPVLNRTFLPETEIKGSVHCANQTWDILTCKVLQDSQRILSLQLPVDITTSLKLTTFQPFCISFMLTQSTCYISFHTSIVCSWEQLACTPPACSNVLWTTAPQRVESSTSVLPLCVVPHSEEKGVQDTSATSLLPHTLVTSHCACTYPSSPILASKERNLSLKLWNEYHRPDLPAQRYWMPAKADLQGISRARGESS